MLPILSGHMFRKCLLLLFWILFLFLPKCSLPYLPPFPRTAGTGGRGQLEENEFSCGQMCPFRGSSVGTTAGLLFYWFASGSVTWHALLTEVVVVVLATREWVWCGQSPAAPGEEACAQADRKVLDGGWSGECGRVVLWLVSPGCWLLKCALPAPLGTVCGSR